MLIQQWPTATAETLRARGSGKASDHYPVPRNPREITHRAFTADSATLSESGGFCTLDELIR
jgi:hypothetical protein